MSGFIKSQETIQIGETYRLLCGWEIRPKQISGGRVACGVLSNGAEITAMIWKESGEFDGPQDVFRGMNVDRRVSDD